MRLAFMGTPAEAVPILDAVTELGSVDVVVTRPDKPRGRSRRLIPPAVKVRADELGLRVAQPASAAELHDVASGVELDVAVVAAYGRILRPEVLALPRHGFLNVHFSLLPRWRGASPVVRAILAGDETTGVSLMQMDEGLDTGPVFATSSVEVSPHDTAGSLTQALSVLGADLVRKEVPEIVAGGRTPVPQDSSAATAAGRITIDEAHVDPARHGGMAVDRAVRAFDPRPGAWCEADGERFKLWRVAVRDGDPAEPGVATFEDGRVMLGVADGLVELLEVQPAGKPRMDAGAWMNGRRGEPAQLR